MSEDKPKSPLKCQNISDAKQRKECQKKQTIAGIVFAIAGALLILITMSQWVGLVVGIILIIFGGILGSGIVDINKMPRTNRAIHGCPK